MATKILVVDDDLNICDVLKLYLENEGYEVVLANDGISAVATFKSYEPDLVLLDIMLPKKDGWQVCREIREISNKPIIMVTAKGEVFDKVLGLELGAQHAAIERRGVRIRDDHRAAAAIGRKERRGLRKQTVADVDVVAAFGGVGGHRDDGHGNSSF